MIELLDINLASDEVDKDIYKKINEIIRSVNELSGMGSEDSNITGDVNSIINKETINLIAEPLFTIWKGWMDCVFEGANIIRDKDMKSQVIIPVDNYNLVQSLKSKGGLDNLNATQKKVFLSSAHLILTRFLLGGK